MKKQLNNLLIITILIVISIGCDKVDSKLKTVDSADQIENSSKNIKISSGGLHHCALLSDKTVKCWGNNEIGQLGDGSTVDFSRSPVVVKGLLSVTKISRGVYHNCAILGDKTVKCWGSNFYGQLGDGKRTKRSTPVVVKGLSSVTEVSSGGQHSCAILRDKTVKCWGNNEFGQLGDGSTTHKRTPVVVKGLSSVTQISNGNIHSCALLNDKTVKCWGSNEFGQLGDGGKVGFSKFPVVVISKFPVVVKGLSSVAKISSGDVRTCAILEDKTVKCWGSNTHGQLGNGSTSDESSIPVIVKGLLSVTKISNGGQHSCAVLEDKTVKCWGGNNYGQLGDESTTHKRTPVLVKGLSSVSEISSGTEHSCAILRDKTVKCWGNNEFGQLGRKNLTEIISRTPVEVNGLSSEN